MRTLVLVAVAALAGCTKERSAPDLACDVAWRAMRTPDGAVALCVAPGYAAVGDSARWARGQPHDSTYAWLSVRVVDPAEAANEWGSPPRPPSFREPVDTMMLHVLRAESVSVHREHVDGVTVEVETARVSGGQAGFDREPAIRAVWALSGGRWALAQGFTRQPSELATLRAMLRTVWVKYSPPAT